MGIIPGGSGTLTISVGIPRKKVRISMELETKMAEAPANCFPLKFHGILQNSDFPLGIWWNPQELMEEGKDLATIAKGFAGTSGGIILRLRLKHS